MTDVIDIIKEFIQLQSCLVDCMKSKYPNSKDCEMLLDFPKCGELSIDGDSWTFKKHGIGVEFKNNVSGVTVDAHQKFCAPMFFDFWRIEHYCESKDMNFDSIQLEREVDKLVISGEIVEEYENSKLLRLRFV